MRTHHIKATFICLLLIGFFTPNFSHLQAQDANQTEEPLAVFSYMKSKNDDYKKMEKEIWKPYMKKEIEEGKLLFWAIYQVEFPKGKHTEYDYVAINVYANMAQLESAWNDFDKQMKKVHPKLDLEKLNKRTEDSRDMIWEESFRLIGTAKAGIDEAAKVIVANRMQSLPGKYNEYIRMEKKIFLPAHQMSVKENYRKNWHFLSRAMPYGSEYGYDFMTIDSYDSMTQMAQATPANIWRDAHPDKDIEEMWKELDPAKLRTVMRGEVWRNVMYENGSKATPVVEK